MNKTGFFGRLPQIVIIGFSFAAAIVGQTCLAQPATRRVPPAPIGSPNVPVGPAANPFGRPPIAIGPAPVVSPYRPQFPPPTYFPAPITAPVETTTTRRPTAFDPNSERVPVPMNPPAGVILPGQTLASPIAEPAAPIGNLRLTITEAFLNRFAARDETRPGEVRDFILGAQVFGHQTTATKVRLDLLPGANNGRAALVLNGTTQSETTGVTPQAKVDVASQQEFVAVKELYFDGTRFSTRHAVVHVRAKNQTLGAMTPLTGTVFGGIANRIAFREAERRRPQAEAVARDRVAERVYPEFDNSIDQQLATANDQLELTVRPWLRSVNMLPSAQQVTSTDTTLTYSAQIADESPGTVTDALEIRNDLATGLRLMIHESLLNSLAANAGLKGMRTTDREIESMLTPYLPTAPKKDPDQLDAAEPPPISLPGMENIVIDIEFDQVNPLTVRLEDDSILVTLRAKFKPAGKDVLPPLAVTLQFTPEIDGDKLVVIPGKVRVESRGTDSDPPLPDLGSRLISQAIESNLTKFELEKSVPATFWQFPGPVPRLVSLQIKDGWAAIGVD